VSENVLRKAREAGWITDAGVADKAAVVLELRNQCPDELLPWIDAAIVLAQDSIFFPAILGGLHRDTTGSRAVQAMIRKSTGVGR
jgi:hypothetical protein